MRERNLYTVVVTSLIFLASCNTSTADESIETFKQQIMETESAFARLVSEEGMQAGFLAYADEQAVLNRNNTLIKGKREMAAHFEAMQLSDVTLDWHPDFIDVSKSGDLGYTFGHYTFSAKDNAGNAISSEGIFHTVWKRNEQGEWRFVWD